MDVCYRPSISFLGKNKITVALILSAIVLTCISVALSVKWIIALFFVLIVVLFILLDIKWFLFSLILLRVNLDGFHDKLKITLGEYREFSLPTILGIIVFFTGLAYLITRKTNFWKMPAVRSLVFFFIACILSFLFSGGAINTLGELMELGSFLFLYIMTVDILQDEKDIKKAANLLILSSLMPLGVGFIELFTKFDFHQIVGLEPAYRLYSTTTHCNVYAFYLVIILILITSALLQEKSGLKRQGLFILLSLLGVQLIFTYARGAWMSLVLALLILGVVKHRKLLILAPLGVGLAIYLFPSIVERFAPIMNSSSLENTSLAWRINLWLLSINYFIQHPILGIGFGNYIFVEYQMIDVYIGAHNDYLRILVETGVIGFSCFIGLLLSLLRFGIKAYKKTHNTFHKHLCLGFLGLWAGYVMISISENFFNQGIIQWYFWTYAAVIAAIYMRNSNGLTNSQLETQNVARV
jgi:putative inorganic carbon (HCO3(-)) transporter